MTELRGKIRETPVRASTDVGLLQDIADAARHAGAQTQLHIEAEIQGLVPELMDTLSPRGPYAYTIIPEVRADGSVRLPVLTTAEQIRAAYEMVCGMRELLSVSALTEVRGAWYTFQDGISRTRRKAAGELGVSQTIALFPCGADTGITGELVWIRRPRTALGAQSANAGQARADMHVREEVFLLHAAYIDALMRNDLEAVLDTLNEGVASAVRDYVNDTGTLIMLEGKAAHRDYYSALFDKYKVLRVEPSHRIAEDWYVFAELRITAAHRHCDGSMVTFNTAEFFAPANDGKFIARIGHGTDPASTAGF
jgi:hypothetical protein